MFTHYCIIPVHIIVLSECTNCGGLIVVAAESF